MSDASVTCPRCKTERHLNQYTLEEGALLVCPNCGAEFSLSAKLQKLPGEEPEDLGMDVNPDAGTGPGTPPSAAGDMGGGGAPPPPPEGGMELGASRTPVVKTKVLVCSKCNVEWLGTHAEKCPKCESTDILVSQKSVADRCKDAMEEAGNGVPPERVLSRLFGDVGN